MANQVMNPQFGIVLRKNRNANNPGYGKYYPEASSRKTLSLRGLCDHMAGHNCIYPRDLIQGVLIQMVGCMKELLSQGNPVKIDGLGTFMPTVESTKEGITRAALLEGKWNANTYVKGVHIRFYPEDSNLDKITSREFKEQCALSTEGVLEPVDLTPDVTDQTKKKWGHKIVPLDVWITENTVTTNP